MSHDGTGVKGVLALTFLALTMGWAISAQKGSPTKGVAPISAWECPASHPIKGNFTTYSGESCIYHIKGGAFYSKTKPERCYATEDDAKADGCRASKR